MSPGRGDRFALGDISPRAPEAYTNRDDCPYRPVRRFGTVFAGHDWNLRGADPSRPGLHWGRIQGRGTFVGDACPRPITCRGACR